MISPVLYFLGTFLLIPAGILLLPYFSENANPTWYQVCIGTYIVACLLLTLAAIWDIYQTFAGLMSEISKKKAADDEISAPLLVNNGHDQELPSFLGISRVWLLKPHVKAYFNCVYAVFMLLGGVQFETASSKCTLSP